jgi:hypothetical protein
MKKILLGLVLGIAAMLAALGLHVVRDSGGTFVVPKETLTIEFTYVDSRSYGVAEFLKLPPVVKKALTERKGKQIQGEVQEALDGLR